MCSEGVARVFQKAYPFLGISTTLVCLYIVTMYPPLHVEAYSTSVKPINGTLQIIECDPDITITLPNGETVTHCERIVDQPDRYVFHLHMIPYDPIMPNMIIHLPISSMSDHV